MSKQFPRAEVAGISVSRVIIGTNWLLGYSHTGGAADEMIRARYPDSESLYPVLEAYLSHGIDTIMGAVSQNRRLAGAIDYARQKSGRNIVIVDTPILNIEDTAPGRAEAKAVIAQSAKLGASFCLLQHSCVEQLVNKRTQTIERIGDYTGMVREAGLIPGVTAHMPELILFADQNGCDIQTYATMYNCLGFMMQVEVEYVASIIHHAKKPVMTFKSMAAGRCTPYVGLNFTWSTIRDQDMIVAGCHTPGEVHEIVEISNAAFERRFPDIGMRSSPDLNQAVLRHD